MYKATRRKCYCEILLFGTYPSDQRRYAASPADSGQTKGEGALFLRKRITVICTIVLLVLVASLASFVSLQLVNSASILANAAPEVIPALREWQGSTGSFTMVSTSSIIVDPSYAAQLDDTARVFQADLFEVTGRTLPVINTSPPAPGDFFLTLSNSDRGIGDEGYLFKVGDAVVISANTSNGVFYGTRTALQILVQDPAHMHIVKGTARDYPAYKERGFLLDVGRKFFSLQLLEDYVKFMSWYKMNDFQLHFNDNEIDAGMSQDWMQKYAAFRLNSSRFPGLAAKDGSYTRQDMRELQSIAQAYAVTITPEIDAPAHALAFTQYRPDLANQKYSKEFLDLENPNTYTFLNAIWNEFLSWFDTTQVHIGADEYSQDDANNYRQFINRYDDYLGQRGKSIRVWGSLSEMKSAVKVNSDIVMDVWDNRWANAVDLVNQGYHIINTNDQLLYIVPKAGYFHDYLDTRLLYEKWEPNIFDFSNQRLNLKPGDPNLSGGMFAEWNDKLGSVVSDADVYARVKPAMQTLGDKMWSGTTAGMTYEQFQQLAQRIGEAPGTHLLQTLSSQAG